MASSGGSLYMSSSSFTDQLLANNKQEVHEGFGRLNYNQQKKIEIPNYKSFLQSSLPILSPTPFSPSSYLSFPPSLSPNIHLDSRHMLFNSFINIDPCKMQEADGSFNKQAVELSAINPGGLKSDDHQQVLTAVRAASHYHHPPLLSQQYMEDHKGLDDGYNWRTYGQKQAKGSKNPRSYYKCTFPNCPTKKKVERNLHGHVTEIVYKGSHNHLKPDQPTRRSSSSFSSNLGPQNPDYTSNSFGLQNQSNSFLQQAPENSSASFGDEDAEHGYSMSDSRDKDENIERAAKRWKGENENEGISASGSQTVREPKIVIQTTSEIDILDDGYRWRKYGQKVVKGNPNPRSYYKCTSNSCPVRKHVERACDDLRAVITTYEGKHNHDVPAARGSGSHVMNRQPPITSTPIRPSIVNNHSNETNYSNTTIMQNETTLPYTLQMMNGTNDGFGFSGYGKNSRSLHVVDDQMVQVISKEEPSKEEPRDYDSLCESFMN